MMAIITAPNLFAETHDLGKLTEDERDFFLELMRSHFPLVIKERGRVDLTTQIDDPRTFRNLIRLMEAAGYKRIGWSFILRR